MTLSLAFGSAAESAVSSEQDHVGLCLISLGQVGNRSGGHAGGQHQSPSGALG